MQKFQVLIRGGSSRKILGDHGTWVGGRKGGSGGFEYAKIPSVDKV